MPPARARAWTTILVLLLFLAGCGETSGPSNTPETAGHTGPATTKAAQTTDRSRTTPPGDEAKERPAVGGTTVSEDGSSPAYGYTYGQASGNRVVEGTGDLPDSKPVDVRLDGVPTWVAGVPLGDDTAWVVTLEDGRAQAFRLKESGEVGPVGVSPDRLAPGQPPLARARDGALELVTTRSPRASDLTHPVPVSPEGDEGLLGVLEDRTSFLQREGDTKSLGFAALPDARFVRSAGGTLSVLSAPTGRYGHAVLGDGIEAGSMTLLRPGEGGGLEVGTASPASGGVFEAVAPLWFEAPGGELLAVSESTPDLATRVSVYELDGSLVAAGPFIGEPFKWRHLIAAGPFGPDGETELVDTLTPHIGGTVEFYRPDFESGSLDIVATVPGYTSHRIYTRNLDTARAGDLDGDGRWELLVSNQEYTELAAIRRTRDGAGVAWTLPAGGVIVTNLASATSSGGRASIAAGREDGVLRIWP